MTLLIISEADVKIHQIADKLYTTPQILTMLHARLVNTLCSRVIVGGL